MDMKLNTSINKHSKLLSVFCLILAFIILMGVLADNVTFAAGTAGTFTFTGFDPGTTIVDSNGDLYKLSGAECMRIYFNFESQANHKYPDYEDPLDLNFEPDLYYVVGGTEIKVLGATIIIKDFEHYEVTPIKTFHGVLEIYGLDEMIPLGIYRIHTTENNGVFNYYATLNLASTISGYPFVRFFDWDEGISNFAKVPGLYGEQMVKSGGSAVAPPVVRERYGYTFTGWDKSFVNVQASLSVYAVYAVDPKVYFFDGSQR